MTKEQKLQDLGDYRIKETVDGHFYPQAKTKVTLTTRRFLGSTTEEVSVFWLNLNKDGKPIKYIFGRIYSAVPQSFFAKESAVKFIEKVKGGTKYHNIETPKLIEQDLFDKAMKSAKEAAESLQASMKKFRKFEEKPVDSFFIANGEYHHYVKIKDGDKMRRFIDGAEVFAKEEAANPPLNLDSLEFYNLMQAYRVADTSKQKSVVEAFEAVKNYIIQAK